MSIIREDTIQAAIVQFLRLTMPECVIHHSPNGGLRTKREAAKLKWMGTVAGIPDITIIMPGGKVAFLEVKGPKGSLSLDQQAFRAHCERYEIPWKLVRSVDDARAALADLGLLTREAA